MLLQTASVLVETHRTDLLTDEFYNRLQRIWERVLLLEDMGIVHNDADKFRYAYQLAEAEIQDLCLRSVALH